MGQYTILSSSIKYTGGVFNCATVYEARKEAYKKLKQVIKRRKNLTDKDLVNLKFKVTKVKKMKGRGLEEESIEIGNDLRKLSLKDFNIIRNRIDKNEETIIDNKSYYNLIKDGKLDEMGIEDDNEKLRLVAYNFYKYIYPNDNNINDNKDLKFYIDSIKIDDKFRKICRKINIKNNDVSYAILILAICNKLTEEEYSNIDDIDDKVSFIRQYIDNYDANAKHYFTDDDFNFGGAKKKPVKKVKK